MTRTAVVIDDSSFQRDLVERTINDWFKVIGKAENGKQGLEMVKKKEPDVVTMDIMMPVMDGLESLKRIKSEVPNTIIVMVTSVDQKEKMKEAARNGADGYVTKAFKREDLKQEFNNILDIQVSEL